MSCTHIHAYTHKHTHAYTKSIRGVKYAPIFLILVQLADEWFLLAHLQNNRQTKGHIHKTVGRVKTEWRVVDGGIDGGGMGDK